MTYDFTSIMDRHGKDAIAVDGLGTDLGFAPDPPRDGFDVIPMWVADMNFQTAPSVCEAITKRLEHQVFGYFDPSEEYYNSIINWQKVRNGVEGLTKEAIGYENGVLGGVVAALQAFSAPGEAILVHSPTYTGFTSVLNNNGRRAVHTELKRDAEGIWRMDYEDSTVPPVPFKKAQRVSIPRSNCPVVSLNSTVPPSAPAISPFNISRLSIFIRH